MQRAAKVISRDGPREVVYFPSNHLCWDLARWRGVVVIPAGIPKSFPPLPRINRAWRGMGWDGGMEPGAKTSTNEILTSSGAGDPVPQGGASLHPPHIPPPTPGGLFPHPRTAPHPGSPFQCWPGTQSTLKPRRQN